MSQEPTSVFVSQGVSITYTNLFLFHRVSQELEKQSDILYEVESWPQDFQSYLKRNFNSEGQNLNRTEFQSKLVQFLFSPKGAKYKNRFEYGKQELICGSDVLNITMSFIKFHHFRFEGPVINVDMVARYPIILEHAFHMIVSTRPPKSSTLLHQICMWRFH